MALELQLEKQRVKEALAARDNLVKRLNEAYMTIRDKNDLMDRLGVGLCSNDCDKNKSHPSDSDQVIQLKQRVRELQEEMAVLKSAQDGSGGGGVGGGGKSGDPPPGYQDGTSDGVGVKHPLPKINNISLLIRFTFSKTDGLFRIVSYPRRLS
jgi:hypothetical protein